MSPQAASGFRAASLRTLGHKLMARNRRKRPAPERRSGGAPWALAAALGAVAAGVALIVARRKGRDGLEDSEGPTPAAFTAPVAATGAFDQTRDAGPDNMRDEDGVVWDEVDEGSDESFPASDPPSYVLPQSRPS